MDPSARRAWIVGFTAVALLPLLCMGLRAAVPGLLARLVPPPKVPRYVAPKRPDAFVVLVRRDGKLSIEVSVRNPGDRPVFGVRLDSLEVEGVCPSGLPGEVGDIPAGQSRAIPFSLKRTFNGQPDGVVKLHFMYRDAEGESAGFGSEASVAIQ